MLEEEEGALAPLTGVPAVKQDIDIADSWDFLLHFNSLKKKKVNNPWVSE